MFGYEAQIDLYLDNIDRAFAELPKCEGCREPITDEDDNYDGYCRECHKQIYRYRREALLRASNLRATAHKVNRRKIGRARIVRAL